MLAGCDRLVHPAVDAAERTSQRRLIGVLLVAPFIVGPTLAVSFAAAGAAVSLSLLCTGFVAFWALALTVAMTGERVFAERAALGVGALAVAFAAAGGGAAGLLIGAALAFEAWWVSRTRAGTVAGIAAAVVVFPLSALIAAFLPAAWIPATPSLWLWLAPVALAVATLARLSRGPEDDATVSAPDGFDPQIEQLGLAVMKLTPAGEIAACSPAAAAALGLSRDALLGRPLLDRVHLADRVAFLSEIAGKAGGRSHLNLRLRVAMAGRPGDRFHPFAAELGVGGDGVLLSLREDGEAELRERTEAAEARAESLEIARGRFLAAVSHELRTPLNSIIGFSDMLLHGMAGKLGDARQEEYVGLIRQSGGHLLSVVNAILDVSKIESGAYGIQPEPFAVREAVDLCHAMLTPQAEAKGINFLVRTRPDAGEIVADRRAVQQIIINLAANAIKFTEAGGKVSVEAIRAGGWLRLVISDTGIGMSEDELGRVGQPFVQVSNDMARRYEGTGLGLSLVKGLVRLHGGEMSIESAPGEGTLVMVALPVAGPVAGLRGERLMAAENAHGGTHEAFRKIA